MAGPLQGCTLHISGCGLVAFIEQSCRSKPSDSGEVRVTLGQAQEAPLLLVSRARVPELVRARGKAALEIPWWDRGEDGPWWHR